MAFEHIGDISRRVLRKSFLRKAYPEVFILPETEGGRWLLREHLKSGIPEEICRLHETDFDEEYRQIQIDYRDYLHSIGHPIDSKEEA